MQTVRQCEERNWPEIIDTNADEGTITSTDQQSVGNSKYTDVSSIAGDLGPLNGTFNITQRNFDLTMESTEKFVYI
ncbi:hypothetical protein DPMN_109616 [Dreissena polymorpha]|uniref:Uncharacterized protein n=1 Tax=Dreissena polymorpha TaxID=45954 RepID=A0A9D4KBG3_DREPO|nr:hypothetical protein DPMN_109616 [Dreissena polymorpha]